MDMEEDLDNLVKQNAHVFEMKNNIMKLVLGHTLDDIEKALMMTVSDVYIRDCSSEDEAMDRMSVFAAKVMTGIRMFSDAGFCPWNATRQ